MPRGCKYVSRIETDQSDFSALFVAADKCANGSDRWAEIQPGYMAFHFEAQEAYSQFCAYIADRKNNDLRKAAVEVKTSEKFRTCRELVHDDAFEAQITLHMTLPLLKNVLKDLKRDYLYDSGIFLRRALTRYLALVLCRLLDWPNDSGKTGITASIYSLLAMAKSEGVLSEAQIQEFISGIEKIKAGAAQGEYDLVQTLRDLRNIQVAHSLIPWKDPTEQLWAHDLVDFAEAIFDFVVNLELALAKATSVALNDLRKNADAFESSAGQFWRTLTSIK